MLLMSKTVTASAFLLISLAISLPAQAAQRFVDEATGFTVQVPAGFDIGNRRADANHDILLDIVSLSGQPPVAGNSHALCAAGFRKNPPDFDQTQEDLSNPSAIRHMMTASRQALEQQGMKIESVDPINREDVAGFELTMIPPLGPDHRNFRLYMAFMDKPVGRMDLLCATTKDALLPAMGLIHAIRDRMTVTSP